MNVASVGLCKELYELSGWIDQSHWWVNRNGWEVWDNESLNFPKAPAYDLGYLLRKLPEVGNLGLPYVGQATNGSKIYIASFINWWAIWEYDGRGSANDWHSRLIDSGLHFTAITPEDAAAKLASELFKQGILKEGR